MKIMQPDCNNVLLNTNISVDNQQFYLQEINNFVEGEEHTGGNTNYNKNQLRNTVNDNISLENLKKVDFKKCFYKQPSQMALGRKEGNLALSSEIDNKDDRDNKGKNILKFLSKKNNFLFFYKINFFYKMSDSTNYEKNLNNNDMLNKKTYRNDPERDVVKQKHLDEYFYFINC
jgi:hypothetical protein